MTIFCTFGHVDHGKSTLLHALTGQQPTRLAEEKERGLTIELGYVWLAGHGGNKIGFIDAPGHQDFRQTTIAGGFLARGFLFVVDSKEGWRQQSEEHLRLVASLKLAGGVVVLTKCDLVNDEILEQLGLEIALKFLEHGLDEPRIISVDSLSGRGVEVCRAALQDAAQKLATQEEKNTALPTFFHVDRVFVRSGIGTVVTGSLLSGKLRVGAKYQSLRHGKEVTVRGMQSYQEERQDLNACARAALNLTLGDVAEIKPGDVIIGKVSTWSMGDLFAVELNDANFLKDKNTLQVRLQMAMNKQFAQLTRLSSYGGKCLVRVKTAVPIPLSIGAKVVLLTSGLEEMLGIATIIETSSLGRPKWLRQSWPEEKGAHLEAWTQRRLLQRGYISKKDMSRAGDAAVQNLFAGETLPRPTWQIVSDYLTTTQHVEIWRSATTERLARQHRERPHEKGITLAQLAKILRVPEKIVEKIIQDLKNQHTIRQDGVYLCEKNFQPRITGASAAIYDKILELSSKEDAVVLSFSELGVVGRREEEVIRLATSQGLIVTLGVNHIISSRAFAKYRDLILQLLFHAPMSVAEIRDATSLPRKFVVLLAEALDHQGYTSFDGSVRSLAGKGRELIPMVSSQAPTMPQTSASS